MEFVASKAAGEEARTNPLSLLYHRAPKKTTFDGGEQAKLFRGGAP